MATIDAVFFDCDGVLVDSERLHYKAFQRVLEPFEIQFDYNLYQKRYIGFDDRDGFIEIARDFQKEKKLLANLEELIQAKNVALKECIARDLQTFDGVIEFIKELHKEEIPLAVVSGSLRDEVELFLLRLGIKNMFRFFITANDVLKSKPHPESYLTAFEKMASILKKEIRKKHCVVFEDTPAGIQAAKSAGLFTIGVTNSFPEDALKDADYVIPSFKDMSVERLTNIIHGAKGE